MAQNSLDFLQNSLNLDFELWGVYGESGYTLPYVWYAGGGGKGAGFSRPDVAGYKVFLDKHEKFSRRYSLKMEMFDDWSKESFGVFTGSLPIETFAGKNVEYRGWIKTTDVKNGYAGLWVRVDGKKRMFSKVNSVLGFDNMNNRGLKGDNEWTQVTIKMKVSEKATQINFGGLFTGEGTAWFDALELYIDGEKYVDYEPLVTEILPTGEQIIITGGD